MTIAGEIDRSTGLYEIADATLRYTLSMNLALAESELPVRLRFDPALTDDELLEFCAVNDAACIERDAGQAPVDRTLDE